MATQSTHPYAQIIKSLTDEKKYFCLPELDAERYGNCLPLSTTAFSSVAILHENHSRSGCTKLR